jgi:thiol-disulfide isomerase/thioredoxin
MSFTGFSKKGKKKAPGNPFGASGFGAPANSKPQGVNPDHENNFDTLADDVLNAGEAADDGSDSDSDVETNKAKRDRKKRGEEEEEGEKVSPYMLFDFRRGPDNWPKNCELVDLKRYDELLEKATQAAEAAAKSSKKKDGEDGDEEKEKEKDKSSNKKDTWDSWGSEQEKEDKRDFLHPEAAFETLKDGSTALVLQAGYRLKLSLSDIFEGGDATREARLKKEAKEKKRAAKFASEWGGWGNSYGGYGGGGIGPDPWDDYGGKKKWKSKRYLNEYTITMDIKLLEEPPREGISLYQTALIHVKENKRSGKSDISRSDGECMINQAGGVGILGTYGDSTKARVKAGQWKRVVVSVRCADDPNAKGELRTWVGTEAGAILKEDVFAANDRFAIDPTSFYLFSSAQAAMMPGKIAIRSIRLENKALSHDEVKANRARDKLLSKFDEDRKKEAEEQRKGLSLAPLFAKPRPMWMAPAFSAIFGDAFIERTTLEASSNLAWSYEVVNFALQQMLRHDFVRDDVFHWAHSSRVALSDTLHIMQQSALVFKLMLKLLKTPTESQLLNFLRRIKKVIQGLGVGETLLFPVLVEVTELMLVLERTNDRFFKLVVVQTDAYRGLSFHAVNIEDQQIKYRTSLVLNSIPKKNILDDVFWMAVYNMAIRTHPGDTKRFYDILLPFLTGHPLEASLVDAENAALKEPEHPNLYGEFRMPQRSFTAYVRCILESFNYLLRRRKVSRLEIDQVHLTFCSELVKMMQNDLRYMLPSANGVRICDLAIKELSYQAVRLVDGMKVEESKDVDDAASPATKVLTAIHKQVEDATESVNICKLNETELPPQLDLRAPQTDSVDDPALMQFRNMLAWDSPPNDPDPGQQVALQKYVPVDLLQIPAKATTRRDAIEAIRRTDRLCTLLDNQKHCIKNDKFIIAALIEHVFTQVIPVPKARGVGLTEEELHRSGHAQRRDEKRASEKKKKEEEKKKRVQEALAMSGKESKKKAKDSKEDEEEKEEKWEGFGDKLEEDLTIGKEYEDEIVNLDCIWDEPVTYELQVELLLSLQRVTEHFAAAVLSIQQSRPFDAVIIIVHGCLAALSDAIMRKVAIDEPSEACTHLMGRTARNRQLGNAGFGVSVGSFATQCETLEVHTPELAIAKTAVLDYFQSPQQRRLEKIFCWEENYSLKPNKALIKYLRMIAKEVALPVQRPFAWLLDGSPITSDLIKNYPELKCYRDIIFWWKYFLNPDIKIFRNYMNPNCSQEIVRLPRMECQLTFGWSEEEQGFQVTAFRTDLRCRPDPKQVDPATGKPIPPESLPTHRYLSTATPSFYVPPPKIKSEDDVIYRPNLPGFDDEAGQVLNQRDSELLISYMTVPYLRVPLILSFFASDDRIHKLQSEDLRKILDSVLFEPGKYLRMDMCKVEPRMVPSTNADLLATPYGMLLNELVRSPDTVIRSILSLLRGALACDTGSVVDEKSETFNTSTTIILYATRLGARVDNYLAFLVDYNLRIHDCIDWPLRDSDVNAETLQKLKSGLENVREILHTQFAPLLEDYLKRLDLETSKDPTNETLIDRNSRLACDLHSHKLLMYRNYHDFQYTPDIAKTLLGSFVYLTTRHTWNKSTVEGSRLQMPETQIYELLQVNRRRMITWLSQCRQGILDEVMQTVLQVSSSLTGSFKASAAILDDQNRWSRIQGERSCGRWAVGSTRTTVAEKDTKSDESDSELDLAPPPSMMLQRQHSYDNQVGEVEDNGMLGVEIDVQLGQMTLRSKHLSALIPDVANHPDVNLIFGDATIQASLIATAENCDKFRLVGLNHEIEYWKTPHNVCPPVGEEWDREYDPAELADTERWIANLFEPIRKSFFDGPSPPPMQFMMTTKATPENAEVAVMVGLHQKLGGPFKLVYLFRRLKCLHIYECVSQGRQWWFTLHLTTDYRYALRELEPSVQPRNTQFPDWWIRAGGVAYPAGFNDVLMNDVEGGSRQPSLSVLIHRDQQHKLNLSGGRETLVPSRLLYGVVPETLLDNYLFWQDESIAPPGTRIDDLPIVSRGYKRMRGYPREEDGEFMIIVEFLSTGDWSDIITTTSTSKSSDFVQCTGFPGRTVKITRRPMDIVKAEFKARQRIASNIESLKILTIPKHQKKKKEKDDKKKDEDEDREGGKFQIDEDVEADHEGNGNEYWPCIVRRINDNGTYDIEYINDYKWVGTQKNVSPEIIQKRGEMERKKRGEGIWHWDCMSDDEDDDWRSSSENGNDDDDDDEEEVNIKKDRLPFHQFDQLSLVLEAGKYDIDACLIALSEVTMARNVKVFTEVADLAKAVATTLDSLVNMVDDDAEKIKPVDSEDMILLNLMYSPRASRLHSVMKVLARIENVGHICAWTKAKNCKVQDLPTKLEFGCPPIDLIELPSLKLSFTGRYDHAGVYRLFSVDHVDLFISNERNSTYEKLLAGIPHSIIMSNVRGETQILVPVIPPTRVRIANEPFSTFIVLQRGDIETLAERFFLYPIHVSFSFLLTKGVNSALYLMLLRLLHRDYAEVFRLADSIATDTQFNKEGLDIYKRFTNANDDWHPDAHACRLKISLVTIDSGMELPWDLTIECARYIVKLDSVSSFCRISPREELQILESDFIVTSTTHPKYNKDAHDEYSMALCYNRLQYLKKVVRNYDPTRTMDASCILPARSVTRNWPYYQDNTIFGEQYLGLKEIISQEGSDGSWQYESVGGDEQDAPSNGWLVVAVFHTLWSTDCINIMPAVEEMIPIYQDVVNFVSVKADRQGMKEVSKQMKITSFPTFLVMRGGKEIDRVEGSERVIERVIRSMNLNVTQNDKVARAKHRHRIRLERALELGKPFVEEEVEEKVGLDWTFDPEQCGENMKIEQDGMCAVLQEDDNTEEDVTWEHSTDNRTWKPFSKDNQKHIESEYRSGRLYSNCYCSTPEGDFYIGTIKISDYEVSGFYGTHYPDYNSMNVRRWGDRLSVPNEEPYLSKEQKDRDKRSAEWREKLAAHRKKMKDERIGKDIECIRGTVGFLANTGLHRWSFRWNHEPSRYGSSDAFGICSELREEFGAGRTPNLGTNDAGASISVLADGCIYHNGVAIQQIEGDRKRKVVVKEEEKVPEAPAESPRSGVAPVAPKSPEVEAASEEKSAEPVVAAEESNADAKANDVDASAAAPSAADGTIPGDQDAVPVVEENKDELPSIETPVLAALYGKKSVIVCEFDTSEGGTFRFFIDGKKIGEDITGVYEKLGGGEIFPCVSFAPLDPKLVESRKLVQGKKLEKINEVKRKQEELIASGQPPSTEDPTKLASLGIDEEELLDIFPSVFLNLDMEAVEREIKEKENIGKPPAESSVPQPPSNLLEGELPSNPLVEGESAAAVPLPLGEFATGAFGAIAAGASTAFGNPFGASMPFGAPSAFGAATGTAPVEDSTAEASAESKGPEGDKPDQSMERVRWMYFSNTFGWILYSQDASRELEEAARDSKSSYILTVGAQIHRIKIDRMQVSIDDGESDMRVRKQIVAEGLQGKWEIMATKFEKPHGLSGAGLLKLFEKVWSSQESLRGESCGLGFIFLYNLLSGESRVKVVSSGYGGYGGYEGYGNSGGGSGGYYKYGGRTTGGSSNDAHRLAMLISQLYSDRQIKSVAGSVINVLARNRQVSLRMPKFKDNRRAQNPFFVGWIDDNEVSSPLADLFSKLAPMMQTLKRKGTFHFPPGPPHPEMAAPPKTVSIPAQPDIVQTPETPNVFTERLIPEISDYGCEERVIAPVSVNTVAELVSATKFRMKTDTIVAQPPIAVEDTKHFQDIVQQNIGKLIILDFYGSWCGPCKAFAPAFHLLSLKSPTILFLKADVDECDQLAAMFKVETVPTIFYLRGGSTLNNVLTKIQGGIPFIEQFGANLEKYSTTEEKYLLKDFISGAPTETKSVRISADDNEITTLANQPLLGCNEFIVNHQRTALGLDAVNPSLAFDVHQHESAQSAPARAVLNRFKDDVAAFSDFANQSPVVRIIHLADNDVRKFFAGDSSTTNVMNEALRSVQRLLKRLDSIKDADYQMIQDTIPLLEHAVNYVDTSIGSAKEKQERVRYLLYRKAGQNSFIWTEFLFGVLISTKGEEDLRKLNPFLSNEAVASIMNLTSLTMLRANRLGHTNRCIGTAINLEKMLESIVKMSSEDIKSKGDVMIPKLLQLTEELAKTITMGRYYMTEVPSKVGSFTFDPRYLVFEFVWNIQLRLKQVEIVNDFRQSIKGGHSKVKQMIMGAGKTSVVAPLLALIVADGKSLVLSVVPKALVEMSRTRMRETFAAIMVKRIYTLDFERSTVVKPAMSKSLENAAINRGVVVCTPTTLKSVMLSYVEVLQRLKEANASGLKTKLSEYKTQAEELAKILELFRTGVMLLDEVDLILHPLKSELNFPIGEKFDLDGSEEGERWNLPVHLFDAFLYSSTGRVSSFEQRGVALDILKQISGVIQKGIAERNLQRLPHIILLNNEFYHKELKPIMAEWTFLWLQKQHLHGIDHQEAIQYLLEGAAAKSDASTKIHLLEQALHKVKMTTGEEAPVIAPTRAHLRAMSNEKRQELDNAVTELKRQASDTVAADQHLHRLLDAEERYLEKAVKMATSHKNLVNEIYDIDEQIDNLAKASGRNLGEIQGQITALQKKIQDIECPRDDSLDNSVVLWCSQAFAAGETGGQANTGDSSVPAICNIIEDLGYTLRRAADIDEAVVKARELQEEGQLRCLIIGGDETGGGCGPTCTKAHTGKCLKCGRDFASHMGHSCPFSNARGSFTSTGGITNAGKNMEIINKLTDLESAYAMTHKTLPASRIAVYSAHITLSEAERMKYWKMDTAVFDASKQLVAWAQAQPSWVVEEEEVALSKSDQAEKAAQEKIELAKMKVELEQLEAQRISTGDSDEQRRKTLHAKAAEKHGELTNSVQAAIGELTIAQQEYEALMRLFDPSLIGSIKADNVGPQNGRDAAIALAWIDTHRSTENITDEESNRSLIVRHYSSLLNELGFLRQMELAAKVVAHVTSPHHKKLLNLSHNWLRTFLPHCLAKVNRVSFGLLSVEDCKAALEADPYVPRSRLKLAVPFVGKDVPSKSSEFAHPDIIIGLTILAYRYSGLRQDDYIDIIDRLTAQFSNEIGPARDRESSLRHEKWVHASGGAIRGLKSTRDGLPWQKHENLSEEELNNKEVVQLKFLQKSNKEQMDKLFELIKLEPLVVHHYLQSMIFPQYMRSQREKISASGQAVGGDMLVGKRVGFSGTPSDLLPQELGRCDYETGDDGMMINTCLDRNVSSYEFIEDKWTVEMLLERIAKSESPRYHALIDTGALITGYSNKEVAKQLLDRGLSWCDGVVFLDDDDKQQVLVRATGRVVSAEQCGVSLEKRFAFYDQIHTTGMDIKHVVNATACVTLGKDMVFRDFVQGAYRMRGIGNGQRIRIFVIPEVKELMQRELKDAIIPVPGRDEIAHDHVLEDVVAWLIINSLRSEQTQWTMLCIQNIGNLYRKNAFKVLRKSTRAFIENKLKEVEAKATAATSDVVPVVTASSESAAAVEGGDVVDTKVQESSKEEKAGEEVEEEEDIVPLCKEEADPFIDSLDKEKALALFTEDIDFSLESGVPDPVPFEDKLRSMLDEHEDFLLAEQHEIGHSIMEIVGQFSMVEGSANRLDTEQEREQEQEQEKEVEQRRDQQVEIEKFVEREYSRQEETQRPWPFRILSHKVKEEDSEDHPFYHLKNFQLKHHEPLSFPDHLFASCNYFNLKWTGLRRVKNVVMVLEYAPSTNSTDLRLKRSEEHTVQLSPAQQSALLKAHTLLGFYATAHGLQNALAREDVKNAILALTDASPSDEVLDEVMATFASMTNASGKFLSLDDFTKLMVTGFLTPESVGRHWVAVSLAEAETIRRVLHVRSNKSTEVIPHASTELALHYSPMCGPKAPEGGDGGVIFDASVNWHKNGTKATWYEASSAHNNFRFFDCDMYYSNASLNVLLKTLGGSVKDRESFFLSMIGVRRRMERKWQETPIAKVFTVPDQFTALRHQALAMFVVESLKVRNMTVWEAFTAFDNDNNGLLSPAEFYGALLWLTVPDLTAEDVIDYFEVADKNRDGQIDYREYVEFLTLPGSKPADLHDHGDDEADANDAASCGEEEGKTVHLKVEPHGAEELREIILRRKQQEQIRQREERIKKQAYKDALDIKIFEEELEASRRRKGGQNPLVASIPRTVFVTTPEDAVRYAAAHHEELDVTEPSATKAEAAAEHESVTSWTVTDFKFSTNQHPLRFTAIGKNSFIPILFGTPADKPVSKLLCRKQHELYECNYYWMNCSKCAKRSTDYVCWTCSEWICKTCFDGHRRAQEMDRRDPEKNPTFLRCQPSCSFTLQVPMRGGADRETGDFSLTLELRVQKLPPAGQLQSLLRFSLPDLTQSKRVHRTSVYLNGDGVVVGRPLEKGGLIELPEEPEEEEEEEEEEESEVAEAKATEEEGEDEEVEGEEKKEAVEGEDENKADEGEAVAAEGTEKKEKEEKKKKVKEVRVGRIIAGKWAVVTVVVQPSLGRLVSYVDGKICHVAEDLDPADLRLQHKLVILGGGKQAHVRGGDVRRLVLHSAAMDEQEVKRMYYALGHDNPAIGGLVTKAQALVRGYLVRKHEETNIGKSSRMKTPCHDDGDEDYDEDEDEDYDEDEDDEER